MPAKSRSQFRRIAKLIQEGKIPKSHRKEWLSVEYKSLPERVKKPRGRKGRG